MRSAGSWRRNGARVAWGVLFAGAFLPNACTSAGVVGGECRAGLSACKGDCVDLQNDDLNCGRCGRRCPPDMPCAVGVCGGDLPPLGGGAGNGGDGGAATGGLGGATGGDAGAGMGGTGGGGAGGLGGESGGGTGGLGGGGTGGLGGGGTGGLGGGGTGGLGGGGTGGLGGGGTGGLGGGGTGGLGGGGTGGTGPCAPPYNTPAYCGDCDTQCTGSTPLCTPSAGTYECTALCEDPLVNCGGQCVELANDPFNCGSCFHRCPSGICQSGTCVGAAPGNLVLMCINYRQTFQGRPQQTLLGNAVFLPARNPVRVLAYTEHTSQRLQDQLIKTLDWAAVARGRTYEWSTILDPTSLPSTLSIFDYDVLLVLDQDATTSEILTPLGASWAGTLDSFARAGGTVVVLSGGLGDMDTFFTNAGLLDVTSETSVTGTDLYNRSPGNALGVGVLSPFRALQDTCVFETTATQDGTTFFVVTDTDPAAGLGLGKPVVVHRIIGG